MKSWLEQYDEATRVEARYQQLATQGRAWRENCLWQLRADGMTIRAIAELVKLPSMTVHRMIKRAEARRTEYLEET